MQWLGDAMAIGCALAWAFAVLAFRRVRGIDAAALNLFKGTLATTLLLATMAALGLRFDLERPLLEWGALALSGILGIAVADTLFLAGLARVDASVAAVADCAYAPTVLALSVVFLHEPFALGLLIGAPLVVLGLAILGYEPRGQAPIDRGGLLLCVGGVMTTAFAVVLAQPALHHGDLVEVTTVRLASGCLGLVIASFALGRGRVALSLFRPQPAWRPAIVGTFFGTYVAMILWLGGMKYGTAARSALLNQSGAIFVLVLSRLLGEAVPWLRWVGAAVALAGVAAVLVLA